jgi:ketosteroid isomerase-like protein
MSSVSVVLLLALAVPGLLTAQGGSATDPDPGSPSDVLAVQHTVTLVAHHIDAREWKDLRALYADDATFNYTAFTGEEPQTGADEVVGGWEAFVPGFDRTQHLLGPVVVTVDGDDATAAAHVRARHEIDLDGESAESESAETGSTWTVGGHYVFRLTRSDDGRHGWLITYHELADPYVDGNRDLPARAQQRAGEK